MEFNDIKSLKEVCGILTERYVLDIINENNKLKNKINELKAYEKPKIIELFKNNNNEHKLCNNEYTKWYNDLFHDTNKLVNKFIDDYYEVKTNDYSEFKELFFDTSYCDIIDCFIDYFTIISNNKHWANRICDIYLTPIGYFLNENLNLENDKKKLKECLLLTFDNLISHIISFELEQ
tara:strand:+ start:134 stop:667 length:534 start_codon:yes stop_codon:yes gene_type:complete